MITSILKKMIDFSCGNIHDIDHLIRVWTYARTIGKIEGLDDNTQTVLEAAAIVHDIACPLCREKYGCAAAEYQQKEGMSLAADFLRNTGLTEQQLRRILYLVGNHHNISAIDSIDLQILMEADFIANASEEGYSQDSIRCFLQNVCKTASGAQLIKSVLGAAK